MRYRREHLSGRTLQHFPLLDDLLRDVCDGMALLAVIHFYCPELIKLEGMVSLSSTLFPVWIQNQKLELTDFSLARVMI